MRVARQLIEFAQDNPHETPGHLQDLAMQAEMVLARIAARMNEVGLRLHPDKTRIVYCKDSNRRGEHEHTCFTFLG